MKNQFAMVMLRCRFVVLAWIMLTSASLGRICIAADRPNILLFIADNWAWPHAETLGDPFAETPVFNRIAREGILFIHTFCPVPSCSPTRSCILTGRAAHQLRDAANLWSGFPTTYRTFTQALEEAGYQVGFCGKGWSPGKFLEFGWSQNPVGKEYKSFAEFMKARDPGKPFFFWNGNVDTSAHRWRDLQNNRTEAELSAVKVPPQFPDCKEVRQSLSAYNEAVRRLDADAGDCISELENRQVLDDTLVVYTSDNGWQMPRGLANCYDSGTRVPMAIRWGSKIQRGRRIEAFISLTDLAPTFMELAGLAIPPEMTGYSFRDLLNGSHDKRMRDHVFIERERHANVRRGDLSYPIRGIRTKDFLYLWNMRPDRWPAGDPEVYFAVGEFGDVDGSNAKEFIIANQDRADIKSHFKLIFGKRPAEELYDLRKDPHQLVNVAGGPDYESVLESLRTRVNKWMRETSDPRVDPRYDEWDSYPYYGPSILDKDGKPKVRAATKSN